MLEKSDPISIELSLSGLDATLHSEHEVNNIRALKRKRSLSLTPESLSKFWGIVLKTAKRTIEATTLQCIKKHRPSVEAIEDRQVTTTIQAVVS